MYAIGLPELRGACSGLRCLFLMSSCSLALCASLHAQDTARWVFTPGDEMRYEVSQATNVKVEAGEAGSFATNAKQTVVVVWRIDTVDNDGVASGAQKIESISVHITMPSGLDLSYDSETGEAASGIAAMLAPMFESLLENEVPVKISSSGEVLECEMPGPMVERLARVPATRAMSYLVTAAGVRQVAEQIALPLPTDDKPQPRELVVENRVLGTLSGKLVWSPSGSPVDRIAKFTPSVTLSLEPAPLVAEDDPTSPQPIKSPRLVDQTGTGTAEFDIAAGRLRNSKWTLDFAIKGELMGNSVTSDVQQTVEVTER